MTTDSNATTASRESANERARENDRPLDTCPCGAAAVCIGQFEGEIEPGFGCDACCAHVDFAECGRCHPLREAAQP